jgi:hypothetical protein
LPPPTEDKRHDLERCEQRYKLYKYGTPKTWDSFYDEVEAAGDAARKKLERALDSDADELIKRAIQAIRRVYEDMRFLAACRSRTPSERNLFLKKWDNEEDSALGALLGHFLRNKTWVGDDGKVIYRGPEAAA